MMRPLRVLVGVCGIGQGHASRQVELVAALREDGWRVKVAAFGRAVEVFRALGFDVTTTWAPMIPGTEHGLDWRAAFRRNVTQVYTAVSRYQHVCSEVRRFAPDVVVTDYEPMTARIAYRLGIPLVTVDQQSKYRHFDLRLRDGRRPLAERRRLELFFPRFAHAYVCSFFALDDPPPLNVTVVPPLRPDRLDPRRSGRGHALVYLSEYLGTASTTASDLIAQLRGVGHRRFVCYGAAFDASEIRRKANVTIKPLDRDTFLADLCEAAYVVSNGGHTLMSEAVALGLPFLACPLPTFDQRFCAEMVEAAGIGFNVPRLAADAIMEFERSVDRMRKRLAASPLLLTGDPRPTIVEGLRKLATRRA
jgi:uncharacterized protein (TIGR00661 family)